MARLIPALTDDERLAMIAAARTLLTAGPNGGPVKFGHRGRSENKIDCLGTGIFAFAGVGVALPDRRAYGRDPTGDRGALRAAAVACFGEPIFRKGQSLDLLRPGDVVLMQWHQQPNHVAIVVDNPHGLGLIHSLAGKCVVEHRLADPWPRRITEGFRP